MTTDEDKVVSDYQTCSDVHGSCSSGWYPITPSPGQTLAVYCDLDSPLGPWIVIHNRQDGKGNFYRGWNDYKNGFGDLGGNFWIGNEIIHKLTDLGYTIMRVELEAWDESKRHIEYGTFSLADEADNYRLQATDPSGNVYNALSYHNGRQFTTFDSDNDVCGHCNCAVASQGAWWYAACVDSSLNGLYKEDLGNDIANSMLWYNVFQGRSHVPMKKARMMIKNP
ncbi:ryncolin-4-like [Mizuhopecten yessoensis]|uniref:ryncolin-4-like n=1 Tax=Mizuhopecten yessoensis TaxID=6573 RepID=UPI000B45B0A4|nr:ryncolin-4-like [Mizuhopecten yessoensis]